MTEEEKDSLGDRLSKLHELGLPLSAHTVLGWYGTFNRVKRFYKEFLTETDPDKQLDYAFSFFIFSYHLRDWILHYEKIDRKEFAKQWEQFVKDYPEIKISRDICNVSKHLNISQESIDKNFSLFWENDPFITKKSAWTIFYDNRKERLFELMRKVLNAWGDFIIDYLKLVTE